MPTTVYQGNPTLTSPLRVWHVVGPMNHGGAEVMVMELLRHKAPGTQVSFLVHQPRGHVVGSASFDAEIIAHGARILPIITPVQSGLLTYFRSFRALVEAEGKPDVIHTHLNARSGLVAFAAWRCGIRRIIVHAHAVLVFRGSLAYRILAKAELEISKLLFAALATDFWGCSREAIESLFARWPSRGQRRVVINNAIDIEPYLNVLPDAVERLRESLSGGRSGLLIGTVGRIVRHKNAMLLVDILNVLRQRGVLATVAIVGREADMAYCSEIRAYAEARGLSDAVQFSGARDDIPIVMAAFDVFVSPSLLEGFGLVGLEAQAAGTPTVLSEGFPGLIDMKLGIVQVPKGFDAEVWASAVQVAAMCKRPSRKTVAEAIAARGFSSTENTRRIEHAWRDPSYLPGETA